jgi:hypothetical protein
MIYIVAVLYFDYDYWEHWFGSDELEKDGSTAQMRSSKGKVVGQGA